ADRRCTSCRYPPSPISIIAASTFSPKLGCRPPSWMKHRFIHATTRDASVHPTSATRPLDWTPAPRENSAHANDIAGEPDSGAPWSSTPRRAAVAAVDRRMYDGCVAPRAKREVGSIGAAGGLLVLEDAQPCGAADCITAATRIAFAPHRHLTGHDAVVAALERRRRIVGDRVDDRGAEARLSRRRVVLGGGRARVRDRARRGRRRWVTGLADLG